MYKNQPAPLPSKLSVNDNENKYKHNIHKFKNYLATTFTILHKQQLMHLKHAPSHGKQRTGYRQN